MPALSSSPLVAALIQSDTNLEEVVAEMSVERAALLLLDAQVRVPDPRAERGVRHGVLAQFQLGVGDAAAGGVFLGEDRGELLLGLGAGGVVDVVEGAELGEHGVGPREFDLQVRSASSSPEDRRTVRPSRGTR